MVVFLLGELVREESVAFYIRRSLGTGPIRFAVDERSPAGLATGEGLSTGSDGEFRRLGAAGLYFAEQRPVDPLGGIASPPPEKDSILAYLKPEGESLRTYLPLLSMGAGLLLIILGIGVVVRNQDAIGWVEIVIGLVMLIGPVAFSINRIRAARARERAERAEREALEARNRELAGEFAKQLETLPESHDPESLKRLRSDRQSREIPYEAVSAYARHATRRAAFRILARIGELGSEGVAREIESVGDAVGLNDDDRVIVRSGVYQTVVWHLLADDRMTDEQKRLVEQLQQALSLDESMTERERTAIEELEGLRGVSAANLPSAVTPIALKFQEDCLHATTGSFARRVFERVKTPAGQVRRAMWSPTKETHVVTTSKRLILAMKSETVIQFPEIFGMEVDADEAVIEITVRDRKQPYVISLPDPIRTARVISIASTLPAKPKGLI